MSSNKTERARHAALKSFKLIPDPGTATAYQSGVEALRNRMKMQREARLEAAAVKADAAEAEPAARFGAKPRSKP
jgi:hypothetical protein